MFSRFGVFPFRVHAVIKQGFRLVLVLLLIVNSLVALALPRVEVLALFKGKAILKIDGNQQLLKVGQVSGSGVKLISSDSKGAVIQYDGVRHSLGLSQAIGSRYVAPEKSVVAISLNERSQYKTGGSINGQPVTFLVDTGATVVALNRNIARQLGIQFRLVGERAGVVTASGTAPSYRILLDQVKVGEISLSNVEAMVVDSDFPVSPLLGMSFLGRLDIREEDGVMYLTHDY